MAKKKKINWRDIGLVTFAAFAWSKLGVGTAVREVMSLREYPPKSETGYMSQAAWQAKYGGSYLDYQDWLRGV